MPSPQLDREITAKGTARSSSGAVDLALELVGELPACPYDRHRSTDWRLAEGGPVVCGICHPPAPGLDTAAAGAPSSTKEVP